MASYLDISLERKIKDNWEHIIDLNQFDDRSLVNSGILKEVFRDTEYFDHYASIEELSKKSTRNFAEKIYKNQSYFNNVDESSPNYPYKYRRSMCYLAENLNSLNPVLREGIKENLISKIKDETSLFGRMSIVLESLSEDLDTAFLEIGIGFDQRNWSILKDFFTPKNEAPNNLSPEDFFENVSKGAYENVYEYGGTCYLIFKNAYDAISYVKYTLSKRLKKQNIEENTIFQPNIVGFKYINDESGKEVIQYTLEQSTTISYPKDLNCMLKDLEKDQARIVESKKTSNQISKALRSLTSELEEKDFDNKLGKIIKGLIEKESEFMEFDLEYEEELQMQIDELKLLIKIVGENGRIIWSVN